MLRTELTPPSSEAVTAYANNSRERETVTVYSESLPKRKTYCIGFWWKNNAFWVDDSDPRTVGNLGSVPTFNAPSVVSNHGPIPSAMTLNGRATKRLMAERQGF